MDYYRSSISPSRPLTFKCLGNRLECMMQDFPKTLPPSARVGFAAKEDIKLSKMCQEACQMRATSVRADILMVYHDVQTDKGKDGFKNQDKTLISVFHNQPLVTETWLAYAPVKNNPEDAAKVPKGNPYHSATSGETAIYRTNSMILRKVIFFFAPICLNPDQRNASGIASINVYEPCWEHNLISYLNDSAVQKAFHVKPTSWHVCSDVITRWNDSVVTILPIIKYLIANGQRLWVFSGDVNAMINYMVKGLDLQSMVKQKIGLNF